MKKKTKKPNKINKKALKATKKLLKSKIEIKDVFDNLENNDEKNQRFLVY